MHGGVVRFRVINLVSATKYCHPDSTGINLSYSDWALGGVGITSQSARVQMVAKADKPSVVQAMCKVWVRQ